MGGFDVSFAGAFGAGLLSFLSPCVLPLVPPYLCFLGGVSFEELTDDGGADSKMLRRVLLSALLFVLGFSTVFISLGATASAIGQMVSEYMDLLAKGAGIVIIILGLHFMGLFKIGIFMREARFQADTKPASLVGAYVVGLAFAFGWTPCVGPILAAILMVAGTEDSAMHGASLLAVYSAGLGLPFLFAAFAMKPFMGLMQKFRRHMQTVERVIGGLLVGTGVLFLTGTFSELAYWLLEAFPALGKVG